jgi:mono/diheme cytochrome c family protein
MKNALQAYGVVVTFSILALLLFSLCTILSGNQTVNAASAGDKLFATNCAACHQGGKNIVNPKKPVIGSAHLASKDAFKTYLLKPSGTMAPYPAIANNPADLAALFDYCKGLK